LVRSRAWLVPTLAGLAYLRHVGLNGLGFIMKSPPPLSMTAARRQWPDDVAAKMRIPLVRAIGRLHKAGVPLLAGSDISPSMTPLPGFLLQQELILLVESAGLTPLEALQTATLNPAKFLEATDSLGSVAVGKLADLVLLDQNPLTDIRNVAAIAAVVSNGQYFDRVTLDSVRARAERAWPVD
jgi:imidazolonepropionase-like amidohydrolase